MAIRKYNPTSAGRRHGSVLDYAEITSTTPEKSLLRPKPKSGGRNNHGHMTTRHLGGGNKQKYRVIDFKRDKDGIPARVATIEYDPNRTCFIALLHYADGEKRYILAPIGLQVGMTVLSGETADPNTGNSKRLRDIPIGVQVHNVELQPGRGGQLARSAGMSVQLTAREGDYAVLGSALGRSAPRPRVVPRDGRTRRQHRSPEREARQGRPQTPHGRPPDRARHRDEPGRPPHGWWRGSHRGWASPLLPDGSARQGRTDSSSEPPDQPLHHPSPPQALT